MKKIIIVMGVLALLSFGMTAFADEPDDNEHSSEVIPGDWDDDEPKLNFEFQDIPLANFKGLRLILTCSLSDAYILYTTDPKATTADTEVWKVYSEPIALTEDCTVRFFARCEGYNDSDVQKFDFVYANYQVALPTLAPDMERTHLMMVTDTPGAEIRYTTDGTAPKPTDALYEGPVAIEANCTYRARAFAPELFESEIAEYVVDFLTVGTPSALFENKMLMLTSDDPKVQIWYTIDPEATIDAVEAWTLYRAPLSLTEECTVRYFGRRSGYNDSEVNSFNFIYSAYQVAAPILISNAEGTYVEMTTETEGAEIYYTTDGSEPTLLSTLYTAPVQITSNGTIRARAFLDGMFDSNIVDFIVTHMAVPNPTAVFENKTLVLSCTDAKADIWYSTTPDAGIENSEEWTLYERPLALTEDCVVRFLGRRDNFSDSDIQSFSFVYSSYQAADPTIERNDAGTHIVMETSTKGGVIHYTADGSEPTAASPVYTEPILIEHNGTFCAITLADGMFDSKVNRYVVSNMAVPVPYASFEKKLMTLTCSDEKAQIWYTTDDEAMVEDIDAWTLYTAPFSLTGNCTLRFFTRRENFNDSDIESLTFLYSIYQVPAPSIARNEQGTHVVMTSNMEGTQIRYTIDGSEPTEASMLYEKPVRITEGATYRARAFIADLFDSEISEYIIGSDKVSVPTAEYRNFTLVLTCGDEGANIWYTIDPELSIDNIEAWTLYEVPLSVLEDCTVRFFAGDDDANASDVQTFVFQRADYKAAAPTIERNEEGTHIVMETTTEGGEIRYTTDGSEPTAESTLYTEPIQIVCNGTFRAKTFADGLFDSKVTDFFVNNIAVPVPYAAFENKALTLTCSDAEAEIWYTTDINATPENMEAWTRYILPVALTEDCTIHFFARRENFNDSDVETFVFIYSNYQVAAPVLERTEDGDLIVMSCETAGAEIRFTVDGSEPTQESELYTEPEFIEMNCTFKAKAFAPGLFDSPVSEYVVANMISIVPLAQFANKKLVLSVEDEFTSIWYATKEGVSVQDTEAWMLYTEPLDLTGDCTVSFFARRGGFIDSSVETYEFVYSDHQAATPVIEYVKDKQFVTIVCETEGVVIRYTTDGSDPTSESEIYTEPIEVSNGITVCARAFSEMLFDSEVSELYIDYATGVSQMTACGLRILREGANLVIYADKAIKVPLFTVSGQLVRMLNFETGRNVISGLAKGIYVIGSVKVRY